MGDGPTVEILKQIRDGITSTNQRLEKVEQGVEHLRGDVDHRLERVEQGLLDLGQFMKQIALDQVRHEQFRLQHIDVMEKDVSDLKDRVRKLEERGRP
jgi:hypothetical protein